MILHFKTFTAKRTGNRMETVVCEKCKTKFHYELIRIGTGKGTAIYGLGKGAASRRASAAADRDLAKRLDREAEMVPCPKCHWVNQELIDRYRRRTYRRVPMLALLLSVVGLLSCPILWSVLPGVMGYRSNVPAMISLAVLLFSLAVPVVALLIRHSLQQRINPNETYPRRPTLPVGTPPALVEKMDPKTGKPRLVTVANREEYETRSAEWAVFRPGQIQLPAVCCICMVPATTFYQPPPRVNDRSRIKAPLCESCRRQLRTRWWLALLGVAVASFALTGVLALSLPGIDATGRWILFTMIGFMLALIAGVVIAGRVCRPYRVAPVDRDRGIFKFQANNPAFTALLVKQVRTSDGLRA
jgi:hypothetical protein